MVFIHDWVKKSLIRRFELVVAFCSSLLVTCNSMVNYKVCAPTLWKWMHWLFKYIHCILYAYKFMCNVVHMRGSKKLKETGWRTCNCMICLYGVKLLLVCQVYTYDTLPFHSIWMTIKYVTSPWWWHNRAWNIDFFALVFWCDHVSCGCIAVAVWLLLWLCLTTKTYATILLSILAVPSGSTITNRKVRFKRTIEVRQALCESLREGEREGGRKGGREGGNCAVFIKRHFKKCTHNVVQVLVSLLPVVWCGHIAHPPLVSYSWLPRAQLPPPWALR